MRVAHISLYIECWSADSRTMWKDQEMYPCWSKCVLGLDFEVSKNSGHSPLVLYLPSVCGSRFKLSATALAPYLLSAAMFPVLMAIKSLSRTIGPNKLFLFPYDVLIKMLCQSYKIVTKTGEQIKKQFPCYSISMLSIKLHIYYILCNDFF